MLLIDSPLPGASMAHTHLFLYKRERPTVSQMFSLKTLCTRGEEIGDWRGAKRVRRDIMSRRLGFFPLRIHPKTSPRVEIRNSPPKIIRSLSVTSNSSRLLLLLLLLHPFHPQISMESTRQNLIFFPPVCLRLLRPDLRWSKGLSSFAPSNFCPIW